MVSCIKFFFRNRSFRNFSLSISQVTVYLGELYDDCYKMYENGIKTLRYDPKTVDNNQTKPQIKLDNLKEQCLSKVYIMSDQDCVC